MWQLNRGPMEEEEGEEEEEEEELDFKDILELSHFRRCASLDSPGAKVLSHPMQRFIWGQRA